MLDSSVNLVPGETIKFITDASDITYKGHNFTLDSIKSETFLNELSPGNNEQYTIESWFYGGSGGGTITFDASGVPCFTKTCDILTPTGYKNITKLKEGDLVLTSEGIEKPIVKLDKKVVGLYLDHPRLIKKGQFGINKPNKDTYLSSKHGFYTNGEWHHPICYGLPKEWINLTDRRVTYYHIKLPDYHNDKLICNGIVTDSWDGKKFGEKREYSWNCSPEKCSKYFFNK
jgi:hypothetical protein